jgi:hypothetical protein
MEDIKLTQEIAKTLGTEYEALVNGLDQLTFEQVIHLQAALLGRSRAIAREIKK